MRIKKTHVVRLVAPIGDHRPTISMDEVRQAIAPRVPVDTGLFISLELQDGSDALYSQGAEILVRKVTGFLEHHVATTDTPHLSLFGFAPMPLVMLLGRVVGDKHPAIVYERHRHTDSWQWEEQGAPLEWVANFPPRPVPEREVALLLSVSDAISVSGIERTLTGAFDIVEITLPRHQRVNNTVRTRTNLVQFAELWRSTLNRIKEDYEPAKIHVFSAAPLSVCLEAGRRLLPKSDPELIVYDRFGEQFRRALSLKGPEPPNSEALPETSTLQKRTPNWRQSLHEFLAEGFPNYELAAWVDGLEPGFRTFLPGENTSRQEFVDSAVQRLEARGWIDEDFYLRLGEHFRSPLRKKEVAEIRNMWHREWTTHKR